MHQNLKLAAAALGGVALTVVAGGIARASMDHGLGHFGNADANGDGTVTTAEWTQAANARFVKLDTNKDGKLVVGEIPRPPEGGPRHHRHHGPDEGPGDDWGPDEQPAAVPVPVNNAAVTNTVN